MKEWKVILAALVIFGAGVVTGALVVNLSHRPGRTQIVAGPTPASNARPPWHDQRYEFVRRMERQLDLTLGQRQQIDQIVRDSQQRTKNLWDSIAGKLQEEPRKVREQINELLTPDQRKKFDALNKPHPRKPEDVMWPDDRSQPLPPRRQPGERPAQPGPTGERTPQLPPPGSPPATPP